MADTDRRKHERVNLKMRVRLWLDEQIRGKRVLFEGFAETFDLGIGGSFITSDYRLPVGCPINLDMYIDEHEELIARGEVMHAVNPSEGEPHGMGIAFTEIDAENRERLLRFFISDRIKEFYHDRFLVQFPHLEGHMSLRDVALVVNLWEDREGRLAALKMPKLERKAARR